MLKITPKLSSCTALSLSLPLERILVVFLAAGVLAPWYSNVVLNNAVLRQLNYLCHKCYNCFYLQSVNYFISLVFKDTNTPSPFIEEFSNDDGEGSKAAKPDHIYMDAMGFGMGCCCLQVSFCFVTTLLLIQ